MKPTTKQPQHPGVVIGALLKSLGLNQGEFAERIGVARLSVNEVLHGKRALTADMAVRIGILTSTQPEGWLLMQSMLDVWTLQQDTKTYSAIKPAVAA